MRRAASWPVPYAVGARVFLLSAIGLLIASAARALLQYTLFLEQLLRATL